MRQLTSIATTDVRHQLQLVPNHPLTRQRERAKTSYTLHFAAVVVPHRNRDETLRTLQGFRQTHIQRLGADGLQYHFVICGDGEILQTRDLDAVLWACANATGNRYSVHINLPLGYNQHPTPAQWRAFERLADALIREFGWPGREVGKGHREWPKYQKTARGYVRVPNSLCPGDILMAKLIRFRQQRPQFAEDGHKPGVYEVTVNANIRQGPGTGFKVAGVLARGTRFEVDDITAYDARETQRQQQAAQLKKTVRSSVQSSVGKRFGELTAAERTSLLLAVLYRLDVIDSDTRVKPLEQWL